VTLRLASIFRRMRPRVMDPRHRVPRAVGRTGPGSLLLFDVQAHSVRDGTIGGADELVQGGQLLFLSN
jgi:hypothetical protein